MSRLRKDIEALALSRKTAKDYDPEDDVNERDEESNDDADSGDDVHQGGREHYEPVGKSKLRKSAPQVLDARYGGVAVRRKDLVSNSDDDSLATAEEDEDDDPFAQDRGGSEDLGSEDSAIEEESLQGFRLNGRKAFGISEVGQAESDDPHSGDSEDEHVNDEEMDNLDDVEGSEEDSEGELVEEAHQSVSEQDTHGARSDLRAYLSNDTKNLAQSLSQAATADAAKGRAVKKQYQTFDRILDARIKLQKGLTASDEFIAQQKVSDFTSEAQEALEKAQEAALQILDTITSLRNTIKDANSTDPTSRKRKRRTTDIDAIWQDLEQLEIESVPIRRMTLNKWSNREKAFDTTLAATKAKQKFQNTSTQQDELTAILDVYIANERDKLLSQSTESDSLAAILESYDDTPFYQSLLRDLITSRSATTSIPGALLPHKLHPSGNKENKKTIDTKASKGRKIRYTVHEKLQGFMASEGDTGRDTAMWTERGKNEFFGSLFGQDAVLREDEPEDQNGELEAEGEALRLFRT